MIYRTARFVPLLIFGSPLFALGQIAYVIPVATARAQSHVYTTTLELRNDSARDVVCEGIYARPHDPRGGTLRAMYRVPAGGPPLVEEDVLQEVGAVGTMRLVCSGNVAIGARIQSSQDSGKTFDDGWIFAGMPEGGAVRRPDVKTVTARGDVLVAEVAGKPLTIEAVVKTGGGVEFGRKKYELAAFGQQIVNLSKAHKQLDEPVVEIHILAGEGAIVASDETRDPLLREMAVRLRPEARAARAAAEQAQIGRTAPSSVAASPGISSLLGSAAFKAAPFQDTMTGLIYMRDRWYDPRTGSFMSPDPAGHRDSPNLYSYCGGDPVNCTDPTGMYEADFHYGLSFYLAKRACFSADVAKSIAEGAERPDQDERAPIRNGVEAKLGSQAARERLRAWHFPKPDLYTGVVEPGSKEAQRNVWTGLMTNNLTLFSEGLHTLQDSWSHQGKPSLGGYAGHPDARGGLSSHNADIPYKYPNDAMHAAEATFNYMRAYATRDQRLTQCRGTNLASWLDIRSEVDEYVHLKSRFEKKDWLRKRGIEMPDELWNDVTPGPGDIARAKAAAEKQRQEEIRRRMDSRP